MRQFLERAFPDHSIGRRLREDGDGVLIRGSRIGDGLPVLFLASSAEHPSRQWLARLEKEHSLRDDLALPWAARPLALVRKEGRMVLLLEDPGGLALDSFPARRLPVAEALRIAIGVSACLSRVHAKGIVHRDINPANILADPAAGTVALTGFGLAAARGSRLDSASPESLAGALAYMAPEQTGRMNRILDASSDLYSLGVVLYEALTGTLPFAASDPSDLLHSHLARQAIPPADADPAIPGLLSDLVMKLLAKPPEERYQTALGVEADLRKGLAEWEARGRIEAFPLGQEDIPDRPLPLQKLYGREAEARALRAAWESVASSGTPGVLLMSGPPGVGKSALVDALRHDMAGSTALFAVGKFDEQKKHIPYASLAQASRYLIRRLLVRPEEEIESWRRAIKAAVHPHGRVLTDILPDLELLLGRQEEIPELAPREAKNRFLATFSRLLDVLATREHPLVLFLDDMQWLDPATLEVFGQAITQPDRRFLLLLGAYRGNEVDEAHPLRGTLQALRAAGVPVGEIVLGPLTGEALIPLLADMLRSPPDRVAPLARLVLEKTGGNPFFTLQFLTSLHEERLLWFAPETGGWTFDLEGIRAKGYTDNVLDLVAGRLHRLTEACRKTLQVLACLGIRAEDGILSRALDGAGDKGVGPFRDALREAERAGLIHRLANGYAFVHDRIREAVYASMAPPERSGAHLRLGRLLIAGRAAGEPGDDEVFEIVNQFNRGLDFLQDAGERDLVRRLNLRAGRKSRAAIAFAAARDYLTRAVALLPQDAWNLDYAEAFATFLELAECEYLAGRFEEAEARFREILRKARTDLDRAKTLSLRVRLYETSGRLRDALETGSTALRLLGIAIPEAEEEIRSALEAERAGIPALLGGRRIPDLVLAPEASDPGVRTSLDLLADTMTSAYIVKPAIFQLLAFRGLALSLRHGVTTASSRAFSSYASLLVGYRDIPSALAFSDLSLALAERFGDITRKGSLLAGRGGAVCPWASPLPTCKAILEQAIEASLQAGDHAFVIYNATLAIWIDLESAESIGAVRENCKAYRALVDRNRSGLHALTFSLCDHFLLCLEGRTVHPPSFEDGDFSEADCFEAFRKAGWELGLIYFHVLKLVAAFTFGKLEEALEHAEKAWEWQSERPLMSLVNATHFFYHALTLAALSPQVPTGRRAGFARRLEELLARLEDWAGQCPETFRSRHALVAAEKARIEGGDLEAAMKAYALAIASARENGFLFLESLACESAGRFYLDRGFDKNAYAHLRDARAGFLRFGAHAKVDQLDSLYPDIEKPAPPGPAAAVGASLGQFDLANVIKASQAVSGEIEPEKLVGRLMGLVMDYAGADRGLLLLPAGDGFVVEAEAELDRQGLEMRQARSPLVPGQVADGVLRYVARTRERVILEDASSHGLFTEDAYVKERKPRSVLGLPLLKQSRLLGVLYLENSLAPGVFTRNRITALEVLASQAAISLENARLFAELEQEKGRFQAVIQQVPAGLIIAEAPSGRFLLKNDRVERILRFAYYPSGSVEEQSQYTGFRSDGSRLNPEDWPLARSIRTGETVAEEEIEVLWADGWKGWLSLSSTPIRDPAGQITSGVVIFQDITERKRREEALKASEERFSKAFRSNPTPMAVIRSKDWIFLDANESFHRLLGYAASDIQGHYAMELGTWFMDLLGEAGKRLAAGRTLRDEEFSAAAKSGEPKSLLASIESMELGGDTCYLASFVDLTERQQVEERLRQSQKLEAIGSLAGGVAHDFNNLLTAINGYSELVMMGLEESNRNYELVRSIRASGERAAGLTRQLLAFSRRETVRTQVQSLNAIVAEMEGMLRRLIEENVEIRTLLDPEAGLINVDKGQVVQILMNLVVNARDAMPEGGRILVETRRMRLGKPNRLMLLEPPPGMYAALSVTDTGTGMGPEVKAKVFEPFFTTKAVGKGTGLGLSVVYGVVKQLGGGISLQSEPGQGTTFCIFFPEVREEAPAPASEAPARERTESYQGSETLLVVEDEDLVRRFTKQALVAQGYKVLESRNGVEALQLLRQGGQRVDLVVTDLIMPDMGGRELATHVRAQHPDLPVLYTSGYSKDMGNLQEALANAEYFLSKPFGPLDLARKVREVLDWSRQKHSHSPS